MLKVKSKLSVAIGIILISQAAVAADPDKKGMTLWLDASDGATLFTNKACTGTPAVANGDIKCWKDKSGQKNNVIVASNAVSPPKLLDEAQNNLAVVDFDQTALITKDSDQIKTNSSYTKFVVFKLDNEDGNKGVNKLSKHNLIGSDPYQTTLWADNGMLHSQHKGSTTNYLDSKKKLGIAKYHIAVTRYSKPDYNSAKPNEAIANILNLDGKREAENFDKADHTAARTSIGGVGTKGKGDSYFYLDGQIAEAIIYNRSLKNKEVAEVEQYLAKKWALPLTQNIIFSPKDHKKADGKQQQLHAIASSSLPITYKSETKGVCKIVNSNYVKILVTTEGSCKVTASQAGNDIYPPAKPVTKSFKFNTVTKSTGDDNKSGGSPLPLGLALLGLLSLLRRKIR